MLNISCLNVAFILKNIFQHKLSAYCDCVFVQIIKKISPPPKKNVSQSLCDWSTVHKIRTRRVNRAPSGRR